MKSQLSLAALVFTCAACEGPIIAAGSAGLPGSKPPGTPSLGGTGGGSAPVTPPPAFVAQPATTLRLTPSQLLNTIQDALGTAAMPSLPPPANVGYEDFSSIDQAAIGTTPEDAQAYSDLAVEVAGKVFAQAQSYPELAQCNPTHSTDSCVAAALQTWALELWHRPLASDEQTNYVAVVAAAGENPTALATGLMYALAGMLQSPNFLYITGIGETAPGGGYRLTTYELARRLAYALLDSGPDSELMAQATAATLFDDAALEAQIRRLLATSRGQNVHARWLADAWGVSKLNLSSKTTDAYPAWGPQLLADAQEEFRRTIVDVTTRDVDLREVLSGTRSFVTADLAAVYGLTAPSTDWTSVALPAERAGLMTSVATLSAVSHAETSTPIYRGVYVLEKLLCEELGSPPANAATVTAQLDAMNGDRTNRARVNERAANPECHACHGNIDPTGMTFEGFDGIGAQRPAPVDSAGGLDGVAYDAVPPLAAAVASHTLLPGCWARQVFSFSTGRYPLPTDQQPIDDVSAQLTSSTFRGSDLAVAMLLSRGFREIAPPAQ